MTSPVVLYRASDRVEASLLAGALANAGIRVDLAGGDSHLLYGSFSARDALQTELWVQPEDVAEGRRVIERYQQGAPGGSAAGEGAWTCSHCGEVNESAFTACWQCQKSRPA